MEHLQRWFSEHWRYPEISPDLIAFGPIHIRWYGMMYILGFALGYLLLKKRSRETGLNIDVEVLKDFAFYLFVGVLLGGRLGYVLFYQPMYYVQNPVEFLYIFRGGMSFHGGLIGTLLAGWLFCSRKGIDFYRMADAVIPAVPIGLGLGRIGNFINAELWGRPTTVPWAMVFPTDPTQQLRHPSQLYEFLLEGVLLFTILMVLRRFKLAPGVLFWTFIMLYGVARIVGEFFREPDAHLSFLFSQVPGLASANLTAGMLLSLPMLVGGLVMIAALSRKGTPGATSAQAA